MTPWLPAPVLFIQIACPNMMMAETVTNSELKFGLCRAKVGVKIDEKKKNTL